MLSFVSLLHVIGMLLLVFVWAVGGGKLCRHYMLQHFLSDGYQI
jgi:hypothetical protein